jgi:hypothetical protein
MDPIVDRPSIPGYGIPENNDGLLTWEHVEDRLSAAKNYWVETSGPDGQPHAVPVWGLWIEGALYFDAGPRSQKNLAANPKVSVHLESGDDVVILEGTADRPSDPDGTLLPRFIDLMKTKYDYAPEELPLFMLRPRKVLAWSSFPANATRWTFA